MPSWRDLPEAVAEHRLLSMGPPVVFRPLEITDGPLLADFYATLGERDKIYFAPHPLDDEYAEQAARGAADPHRMTIVATQMCDECGQTLLLGYIFITERGPGEPWWLGICVRTGYRNHGIGRNLFQHLFAVARAAGVESIGLNMHRENARALHLYQSMGFVIYEELINPVDGLPQYKMKRQL